jgi:uncharacterized protein YukE
MNQPTNTKRLEIAVTPEELHTIQHALSYYAEEMQSTGDEVAETIGTKETELWYKKATAAAAVLEDVNRILKTRRAQAIKAEIKNIDNPYKMPGRTPQTAAAARWIDQTGKIIIAFLIIVATYAALSAVITQQP